MGSLTGIQWNRHGPGLAANWRPLDREIWNTKWFDPARRRFIRSGLNATMLQFQHAARPSAWGRTAMSASSFPNKNQGPFTSPMSCFAPILWKASRGCRSAFELWCSICAPIPDCPTQPLICGTATRSVFTPALRGKILWDPVAREDSEVHYSTVHHRISAAARREGVPIAPPASEQD